MLVDPKMPSFTTDFSEECVGGKTPTEHVNVTEE